MCIAAVLKVEAQVCRSAAAAGTWAGAVKNTIARNTKNKFKNVMRALA